MVTIVERTLGKWRVAPSQPAAAVPVPNTPLPPYTTGGQVGSPGNPKPSSEAIRRSCLAQADLKQSTNGITHPDTKRGFAALIEDLSKCQLRLSSVSIMLERMTPE